jgi:hypothetical protein
LEDVIFFIHSDDPATNSTRGSTANGRNTGGRCACSGQWPLIRYCTDMIHQQEDLA